MFLITMVVIEHNQKIKMNQTDINYIVEQLSAAVKQRDWGLIEEIKEYVIDFQDVPQYEEE